MESGSFKLVPMAISILAITRVTEARIISKAGASAPRLTCFLVKGVWSNCWLTEFCQDDGSLSLTNVAIVAKFRTILLDNIYEENRSYPSSWRPKSSDVLTTDFAFLEVYNVMTMITPASSNSKVGVGTFPARPSIRN